MNIDVKVLNWLKSNSIEYDKIEVVSADASFRSYYRIYKGKMTKIVMDSSLQKDSLVPFVEITNRLQSVNRPKIYTTDLKRGFLLMEDLGNIDLFSVLREDNFKYFYEKIIDEIVKMQTIKIDGLPMYDRDFLHFEMSLMKEWYLDKYLKAEIDPKREKIIKESMDAILEVVLSQPCNLFVHRDLHSRNIMVGENDKLFIIDYQDARVGAVTYDLVSILRDCYISFDSSSIEELALRFRDRAGLVVDNKTFLKWFDFTGLQRHIKVLGIFARLSIRDGKDRYLDDLPQVLEYIYSVGAKYDETMDLVKVIKDVNLK
ncbi:COG3178: Predicted phosphotransferase related to Ser/Thr protein kinases [hydrothermal vent metagenome]|uniref:COG3178: Predicted phosphotransferase related to Ser/Thr protein kinases n=1 Tax=hydrothermal vent metagenome TaxID=652676 RepID=A0A1W1CEI9_9ZZZZ